MPEKTKDIRLVSMRIQNFKGIKDLSIDTDSPEVLIRGYNATGKSTIVDAYTWLLFRQNAAGVSKFEVRPRGKDWNEIHDIITSVEATFRVTDPETDEAITFTLKKEQVEDLTKEKRAALKPEDIAPKKNFFFIDMAPYQEKNFLQKVDELLGESSRLQLITVPGAFFQKDEKEQRKMLFDACGAVKKEDVPGWEQVKEICGAVNTPEQTRESLQKSIAQAKKRAEGIPAIIDGVLSLADSEIDVEEEKAKIEKSILALQKELSEIAEQKKEAFKVKKSLAVERPKTTTLDGANFSVRGQQNEIQYIEKRIKDLKQVETSVVCPNCGTTFKTVDKGAEIEKEEKNLKEAQVQLEKFKAAQVEAQKKYDDELETFHKKLSEMEEASASEDAEIERLSEREDKLKDELDLRKAQLNKVRNTEDILAKVHSLREELAELDEAMGANLDKLDVVKNYINTKQTLEMEKINGKFKTIEFRLFERQTNGETKDVCKAVINGVSYASQNTASKVKAGMEVANLLSEFYGITTPIFLDNAESVFEYPEMKGQKIFLMADRKCPVIEVQKASVPFAD